MSLRLELQDLLLLRSCLPQKLRLQFLPKSLLLLKQRLLLAFLELDLHIALAFFILPLPRRELEKIFHLLLLESGGELGA